MNNIDDIFKSKLQNREVPFNEDAWLAAEKLIIAEEEANVWYMSRWAAALLFLGIMTIGGVSFYLISTPTIKTHQIAENKTKTTTPKETPSINSSNNKKKKENNKTSISASKSTLKSNNEITKTNVQTKSKNQQIPTSKNQKTSKSIPIIIEKQTNSDSYQEGDQHISTSANQHISKSPIYYIPSLEVGLLETQQAYNNPVVDPEHFSMSFFNALKKIKLDLLIGVDAVQGFTNPSDYSRIKTTINPVIGIKSGLEVNTQFSLDFNILYAPRKGVSSEKLPNEYRINDLPTTTKSLHYISMPIYLNYHFDRHALKLGLQYAYLATTTNETISINKTTLVNQKNNYYATTDLAFVVGYQYTLTEKLGLDVRYNFGLFDVTDSDAIDKNNQLRIMIDYSINNR